jgi:hypothetical protein
MKSRAGRVEGLPFHYNLTNMNIAIQIDISPTPEIAMSRPEGSSTEKPTSPGNRIKSGLHDHSSLSAHHTLQSEYSK